MTARGRRRAWTPRPASGRPPAATTATRTRSATSPSSTPRCRTSRMAGRARTTSAPASTGSAIAAACSTISRSTSSTATTTARSTRGRHLQLVGHRHQRRRLHRRLDQRHVEGHQPPDAEPRRPPRELQGSVAGSVAARRTAFRRSRAGPTRATSAFVAPKDVTATTVANTTTLAPKFGFAYDLTGDNRTVIKGFIGQSRWNSADTLADQENPVGLAQLRYAFVSCAARPDHRLRPQRRSSRQLARRARRVPALAAAAAAS